jgi:hypothetical protein
MPKPLKRKSKLNKNQEMEFLRDFDLLATPDLEETALYLPAKLEVAEALMKDNFVLKDDGNHLLMQERSTPSAATSMNSSVSVPGSTCCSNCLNF